MLGNLSKQEICFKEIQFAARCCLTTGWRCCSDFHSLFLFTDRPGLDVEGQELNVQAQTCSVHVSEKCGRRVGSTHRPQSCSTQVGGNLR